MKLPSDMAKGLPGQVIAVGVHLPTENDATATYASTAESV